MQDPRQEQCHPRRVGIQACPETHSHMVLDSVKLTTLTRLSLCENICEKQCTELRKTLNGLTFSKVSVDHCLGAAIVWGLSTIKQTIAEEGMVKNSCSLQWGQEWEETKTETGCNNQTHPSKATLH